MQTTILGVIEFLKKPNCASLQISSLNEKLKLLIKLLFLSFIVSFSLGILISILANLGVFELDSHAISKLFAEKSKTVVFLTAVVAAPIIEELIFRAPITFFCPKKQFKYIFYAFAIVFGFVHIYNYEISTIILILSPILIAPQVALGLILGYTRIKLGLVYAIALHMLFNGILIVSSLLFMDKVV